MSTYYHTAITTGAAANAATFNTPMARIDAAVYAVTTEVDTAQGSAANLNARLNGALNSTGALKSNAITLQSQIAMAAAGSTSGDVTRYDEFAAGHTAATGAHRTDVEIITKQAQVNLDSAAAATGDAVRYAEFTHEHKSTGDHTSAAFIIAQTQVNLATAAATGGDAVRYDEFTHEHKATGDHTSAAFVIAQTQVDLATAAVANGDAVRFEEFTHEHNSTGDHKAGFLINTYMTGSLYSQAVRFAPIGQLSHQTSNNTNAAALHTYHQTASNSAATSGVIMRGVVYKDADMTQAKVYTKYYLTGSNLNGTPYIQFSVNEDALMTTGYLNTRNSWRATSIIVDVTSLGSDAAYDFGLKIGFKHQTVTGEEYVEAKNTVVFSQPA